MDFLTPELLTALAPYGIGGLVLVLAFKIYMDRQKTKRVRMLAEANRHQDVEDI